jgi:carboxymethylenebutenolidase
MGQTITLTASDGHKLACYRADPPKGKARAGLVVIQEIFGVNAHMRSVADRFAAEGYAVAAPALFGRIEKGLELGYEEKDITQGRALRDKLGWDKPLADIQAALETLKGAGKVGVVGYCWGGSLTWVAACRLPFAAAVGYYGAQIIQFNTERPRCPTLLHFGDKDASIPMDTVDKIRQAHPEVTVRVFPGEHGFNCDHRRSYHADSAAKAYTETLAFFAKHLI